MITKRIGSRLSIPNHYLVAMSAVISKVVIVLVQLLGMRLLIDGLGISGYAVFVLLSALLGWYMLVDMGIGAGLQNEISKQRAINKSYSQEIIASLILCVVLLATTMLALFFVSPDFALIYLKQFQQINELEKTHLFFATGSLFIGCALGSISYRIWLAEHKGYISNLIPAFASIISYIGILVLHSSNLSENIFWNLIVFYAPATILPICSAMVHFKKHFKISKKINFEVVVKIIKNGLGFWFFTAITSMSLQIDYFVMSQFLEANEIIIYNLSTKIFWFIFFIYISCLTPLWPIFSESIAKGDWEIVRSLAKKYLGLGLIFNVICLSLIIALMPFIVEMLAPNQNLLIPSTFLFLLAIYQLIRIWCDTFAMILQSVGDLKSLTMMASFQAFLSLLSQWYLVQYMGINGIILGNILSFALTIFWFAPAKVYKYSQSHSIINGR